MKNRLALAAVVVVVPALAGQPSVHAAGATSPALVTPADAAVGRLPAWGTEEVPQAGSGRSQLNAVSVVSRDDAWAVGNSGFEYAELAAPVVERWDGTRWSIVGTPDLPGVVLRAVVAVSSDDVWMVGAFNTSREAVILHWDGRSIKAVAHPNPGGNRNDLYAISATGPDDVWAVG